MTIWRRGAHATIRRFRNLVTTAVLVATLSGCPLFSLSQRSPSDERPPGQREAAATAGPSSAADGATSQAGDGLGSGNPGTGNPVGSGNPLGSGNPPASGNPVPVPTGDQRGVLAGRGLGYYLTGNTGALLRGTAEGPDFLTGNTGAILTGNTGAILTGNTGAILTGNTGALLVGNSGGAYKISAESVRIANGFVYLTAPDERFYVTPDGRLYGSVTDGEGRFEVVRPDATESVVVNVLLSANRRLTGIVAPGNEQALKVSFASTLVTEFLRAKANELGFSFTDALADTSAAASIARLNGLTEDLVRSEAALGRFQAADLVINNLPTLRHKYVLTFGTGANHAVSDEWVKLLKRVMRDEDAPDVKYRPVAVTTLTAAGATESFVPEGMRTEGLAVDQAGNVHVVAVSNSQMQFRSLSASGESRLRFSAQRQFFEHALSLAIGPGGRIVVPSQAGMFLASFDPGGPDIPVPVVNPEEPERWTNPTLLADMANVASGSSAYGLAIDDKAEPGIYYADAGNEAVYYIARAFSPSPGTPIPFAGRPDAFNDSNDKPPQPLLADLKLESPGGLAFHRRKRDGAALLYIADLAMHILIEIDIGTGTVRKIAGVLPPLISRRYTPECYSTAEEGADPASAHLHGPFKMVFDRHDRLIVADTYNGLIRLADIFAPAPRMYTIAGLATVREAKCGPTRSPPLYATGDGESRQVAIGEPLDLAFDPAGDLIVTDQAANRVRKLWLSYLE